MVVRSMEDVRQTMLAYDQAHAVCPVDQRRWEREAEEKAREAREALEQKQATSWWATIDQRIALWWQRTSDVLKDALAQVIASERHDRRQEVKDAIEEAQRAVDAKLAALEARLKSVPGAMPIIKTWREQSVTYRAEFVTFNGSLWQARKDTAETPGSGPDWIVVARHGTDGVTPVLCGDFDVHQSYAELDIVSYDGSAYIARRDGPGLPGVDADGWQVLSAAASKADAARASRGGPVRKATQAHAAKRGER